MRSTVSFNNNDCFIIYILFVSLVRWFAGCLVVWLVGWLVGGWVGWCLLYYVFVWLVGWLIEVGGLVGCWFVFFFLSSFICLFVCLFCLAGWSC